MSKWDVQTSTWWCLWFCSRCVWGPAGAADHLEVDPINEPAFPSHRGKSANLHSDWHLETSGPPTYQSEEGSKEQKHKTTNFSQIYSFRHKDRPQPQGFIESECDMNRTSVSLLELKWSFSSRAHLYTGPLRSSVEMWLWLNISSLRFTLSHKAGPRRTLMLFFLMSTERKLTDKETCVKREI